MATSGASVFALTLLRNSQPARKTLYLYASLVLTLPVSLYHAPGPAAIYQASEARPPALPCRLHGGWMD